MTPPVKLLILFTKETDTWQDGPLYLALVQRLRHLGVAGATVHCGIMGYGRHHRVHHKGLFGISDDRPMMVTAIDEEAKLKAALPELRAMSPHTLALLIDAELLP